jgi:hypothetical protein
LLFIFARTEGYAREIARYYKSDLDPVQKQLEKLEFGGVLVSKTAGRTRLYSFNPRYAFLAELRSLLEKALSFYSSDERESLTNIRRRPRRKGKPL